MEPIIDKVQEVLLLNTRNTNIMHMGYTILADATESGIDENCCLIDNQSTCKAFINGKYMSSIRDPLDGKYPNIHCNTGVNYTNTIGEFLG